MVGHPWDEWGTPWCPLSILGMPKCPLDFSFLGDTSEIGTTIGFKLQLVQILVVRCFLPYFLLAGFLLPTSLDSFAFLLIGEPPFVVWAAKSSELQVLHSLILDSFLHYVLLWSSRWTSSSCFHNKFPASQIWFQSDFFWKPSSKIILNTEPCGNEFRLGLCDLIHCN